MAKRWVQVISAAFVSIALTASAAGYYYLYAPAPDEPNLTGELRQQTVQAGGLSRSYLIYTPAGLPAGSPLLLVFHGSRQDGAQIRKFTGYAFDRLADAQGFAVAYPDGYLHNWNDCRKAANYPARAENVDDVGFATALINREQQQQRIDPHKVFAVGYSNGAHLVFRLALEHPELLQGIATFAANLPTQQNSVCEPSGKPIAALLVNGTADPINPFAGGEVVALGTSSRGEVISAHASAAYFAALDAVPLASHTKANAGANEEGDTWLEEFDWRARGKPDVTLVVIHGGGHKVPQPFFDGPRLLGVNSKKINGPDYAWAFFKRQLPQ